jgi:hypothetical protein
MLFSGLPGNREAQDAAYAREYDAKYAERLKTELY